jgi:hypothetical protein
MPLLSASFAFQPVSRGYLWNPTTSTTSSTPTRLQSTTTSRLQSNTPVAQAQQEPQVFATGYSQAMDMKEAIQEATDMALQALPRPSSTTKIDLAIISVSSLYDGNTSPSEVVPTILEAASKYGQGIQHLVGSTSGGFVSSRANLDEQKQQQPVTTTEQPSVGDTNDDSENQEAMVRSCLPIEREGVPGVSVTLCVLPDVQVKVSSPQFCTVVLDKE